jgi:hypothetical protein
MVSSRDGAFYIHLCLKYCNIEASCFVLRVVHERGWMECGSGSKGAYGAEVSEAFNRRIGFCLGLHNESVKVKWQSRTQN